MGASDDEMLDTRRGGGSGGRGRRRSPSPSRSRSRDRTSGGGSGGKRRRGDSRSRSRSRSRDRNGSGGNKRARREEGSGRNRLRDEEDEEEEGGGIDEARLLEAGAVTAAIPRAQVTESNGEVSCSIEETNRIRALLGLRPLDLEKKESAVEVAMKNMAEKKAEEQRLRELAELEARIERARRKRLLNEKLQGAKLSDVQGTEDESLLSAADWVKRSRAKEDAKKEEERLLAEKRRRMLEEEEEEEEEQYTARDLAGLKVAHDLEELGEGQEVILTLKDDQVLERDEHGNVLGLSRAAEEGGLELENALLSEKAKDQERQQRAKRARLPAYSGVDDEEFDPTSEAAKKKALLSQYDEEERIKAARARKGLVLTSQGQVVAKAEAAADADAQGDGKPKPAAISLLSSSSGTRLAADYYSAEEAAKFNKPKKLRKKKSLRRKESDLVAELEATADGEGEGGGSKASSRAAMAEKRGAEEEAKRAEREAAYQAAVEKRSARDRVAAGTAGLPDTMMEEDDPDLAASLERARRLARIKEERAKQQQAAAATGSATSNSDVGASVLERLKQAEAKAKREEGGEGAGGKGVVFTSTVEFSSLLQARLEEGSRERVEREARSAGPLDEAVEEEEEEEDIYRRAVESRRKKSQAQPAAQAAAATAMMDVDMEGQEEEGEDEVDFLSNQPVVAKGMAATLALLRNTGELSTKEQMVGRDKDKKTLYDVGAIGKEQIREPTVPEAERFKDIKIEYRDADGRLLTTKEEFRRLNYKFHGFGSGRKKEEKRQKKIEEVSTGGKLTGEGWKALGEAQAQTGQAFVVLTGKEVGVGGNLPMPPPPAPGKGKGKGGGGKRKG